MFFLNCCHRAPVSRYTLENYIISYDALALADRKLAGFLVLRNLANSEVFREYFIAVLYSKTSGYIATRVGDAYNRWIRCDHASTSCFFVILA